MKHTLCTMLAVLSLSGAYAQKNSILLFGNSTGGSNSTSTPMNETSSSFIGINAGVGYQFSDHITAGPMGYYNRSSYESKQLTAPIYTTTNTGHGYGVGLFGRYTHYLGDRFFVYLQADATYNGGSGKATSSQNPYASECSHWGPVAANLTPALGCFVYKGWAVNMSVGSVGYRYSNVDGVKTSNFSYNLGSFGLGFSKNFTRKAKPQAQGVQ